MNGVVVAVKGDKMRGKVCVCDGARSLISTPRGSSRANPRTCRRTILMSERVSIRMRQDRKKVHSHSMLPSALAMRMTEGRVGDLEGSQLTGVRL